jgi:NAD-dependent SIR2 family protein deacetylase
LLRLITDQDYFVLTTNVDHCFQKAGFDKQRLFYTQGDYGLWQCSEPCHEATYDNEPVIRQMVKAQGFVVDETDIMILPKGIIPKMTVPTELVPRCPQCGKHMTMNLRCDDTFVEDAGWYQASKHYKEFLSSHQNQAVLYLELGVGYNTPGIIKYPFWRLTAQNPDATYACINAEQLYVPEDIAEQSIYLRGDIGEILKQLK